jgi:hypothetical protein
MRKTAMTINGNSQKKAGVARRPFNMWSPIAINRCARRSI